MTNLAISRVSQVYDGTPISQINYDLIGLLKQKTYNEGLIIKVLYLENTNPILEENYVYGEAGGLFINRTTTISYYDNFGVIDPEFNKVFIKEFTDSEKYKVGETRRQELVDGCKTVAFSTVGPANAFNLLLSVQAEIDQYISAYITPLLASIGNTSLYLYLDVIMPGQTYTLREYLITTLNYDA